MRIVLLMLLLCTLLSGCDKPGIETHDPKQYSLLNDQLVYNAKFAEIFSLDPANAIELDPGVLAIRIYWTVFANKDFTFMLFEPHERKEHMASMRVQLFLEEQVPVQLLRDEGTLYQYESFVRSGFRYFPHKAPNETESMWEKTYQEFHHRIFLSHTEDGAMSSILNRYKRTLVPGVTALEFGGPDSMYSGPFAIYLYIGDEPASPELTVPQLRRAARNLDDYDPELFFRVQLPDELAPVLRQPYR